MYLAGFVIIRVYRYSSGEIYFIKLPPSPESLNFTLHITSLHLLLASLNFTLHMKNLPSTELLKKWQQIDARSGVNNSCKSLPSLVSLFVELEFFFLSTLIH